VEPRDPAARPSSRNTGGRGERRKAPRSLQALRRRIAAKAKAEESWRFWGLLVPVCKRAALCAAYRMAQEHHGAPGWDGVTFEAIESAGGEAFLEQIRDALGNGTSLPPG
jgi:RNA-directed DNA polymerase